MQDIRLVGSDGEYLNLETQSGEKFRLVLDDPLRSAVKRETSIQLDSVSISPREIQDLVRSGVSAEEVAIEHSVPLDYVEKFALTVVDEIGHIIASAQTVRISVEADRYSEASQLEFGEVLEGRLRKIEATHALWSASKLEGEPWLVSVQYKTSQGDHTAIWSFDQRKLVLSPENDAALKLSDGDFASGTSAPRMRQVDAVTESIRVVELPRVEQAHEPDAVPAETPPATISSIEELTRSSLKAVDEVPMGDPVVAEQLSPTADLLEALRKKRTAAAEIAATEATSSAAREEETHEAEPEMAAGEEVTPDPIAPAVKKGRPSMPSWDEIVFGTKTDD